MRSVAAFIFAALLCASAIAASAGSGAAPGPLWVYQQVHVSNKEAPKTAPTPTESARADLGEQWS